jgi:hypothetical protein
MLSDNPNRLGKRLDFAFREKKGTHFLLGIVLLLSSFYRVHMNTSTG